MMKFMKLALLSALAGSASAASRQLKSSSTSEDEFDEYTVLSRTACKGVEIALDCELDVDEVSRMLVADYQRKLHAAEAGTHLRRKLGSSSSSPEFDLNFDNCEFFYDGHMAENYEFILIKDDLYKYDDKIYGVKRTWDVRFILEDGTVITGTMNGATECQWKFDEENDFCDFDGFGVSWNDC